MNTLLDRSPVIIGVGEVTQKTKDLLKSSEPLDLMESALRAAEKDAGNALLQMIDSLDVIQEFSWPYADAPAQLSDRLGIHPKHCVYGPVGGETPVYFIHEAALRIWQGESEVAAIVGAEAQYAVTSARKQGAALAWSPRDPSAKLIRGTDYLHRMAVELGVASPATVYPFYENATLAAWGQTPEQARAESGKLWEKCSSVAASNPYSWQQQSYTAEEIASPNEANRMVAWPYTVQMVANPQVNQGAAVLLTSRGKARQLGIPDERMVHVWCGAAANEPADYLHRDQYVRVHSQEAVLEKILQQVGDLGRFDQLELYSCFPVVPKMARRTLAIGADTVVTCTGGLSFFGAPLNNYMTHATSAMVRALRGQQNSIGLLYGQGGYLTKHHAIVLGSHASATSRLSADYSVQETADARRHGVPALQMDYSGPASIESFTVIYRKDTSMSHGVVILRSPHGTRLLAKVSSTDQRSMQVLTSMRNSPIGISGHVSIGTDAIPVWEISQ